ncbi:hypothetical protein DXG03_008244 [Asterophora parasitica]|uniref:Cwf15/Cwc15 cell cycle control protein n=1 Tax=Asterophora parasitica TaxID=117018 RepID=A0A9P7GCH1_9AGAR|nr:hypothetical protein DXG03_008244 [Asterophora parasitica]
MATRVVSQRFTAEQALRFLEQEVYPRATKEQLQIILPRIVPNVTDLWEGLNSAFVGQWATFRTPPPSLGIRPMYYAREHTWVLYTVVWIHRFLSSLVLLTLTLLRLLILVRDVYSPQANMGPSPGKRCQRGLPPILGTGYGGPHKAQISVRPTPFVIHSRVLNVHRRQHGQTSTDEVKKRDLRAELLAAEQEAKNKKRKAEGKPPLPVEGGSVDDEANKRRKLLQEALEQDKDDDDEEDENKAGKDEAGDSDEDDSDEEDEEDDTAELLRELEKIKRERAEEKARQEREESATTAAAREADIATGNPLLNLAAALGQQVPNGLNTTAPGTFSVKRRWDDDLIFKNQAMDTRDKGKGHFVNDLLRTEFHKKFMAKFIKVR